MKNITKEYIKNKHVWILGNSKLNLYNALQQHSTYNESRNYYLILIYPPHFTREKVLFHRNGNERFDSYILEMLVCLINKIFSNVKTIRYVFIVDM